jgi:hypothetical protein
MAYAATPAAPRPRPSTVTLASYLLYVMAALQVISAILTLSQASAMKQAIEKAYAGVQGGSTAASVASAFIIVGAIIGVLFAIGFVVLGIFVGRGSNAARIVTWVIAGLSVCCGGIGLFTSAAGGSFGGGSPSGGPSQADVQRAIKDALPSWYGGTTLTLGTIGLLCALAVIVLLLLPASNEYFRKQPAQVWEPPTPGGPAQFGPPPSGPPSGPPQFGPPPSGPPPSGPPPSGPPPSGAPPA